MKPKYARCVTCGQEVELSLQLLQDGCPYCGGKRFINPNQHRMRTFPGEAREDILQALAYGALIIDKAKILRAQRKISSPPSTSSS